MSDITGVAARIRVSLATGELEVEGTEAFVSQYEETIAALLERLRTDGQAAPVSGPRETGASSPAPTAPAAGGDEPFGEVLHLLTSKSGTDQSLLAGYYAAKASPDGSFSTAEASRLLVEQGVKLSNPSQSLKNNLNAKRAFKVGSRYKVSKVGLDHLKTLGVVAA